MKKLAVLVLLASCATSELAAREMFCPPGKNDEIKLMNMIVDETADLRAVKSGICTYQEYHIRPTGHFLTATVKADHIVKKKGRWEYIFEQANKLRCFAGMDHKLDKCSIEVTVPTNNYKWEWSE